MFDSCSKEEFNEPQATTSEEIVYARSIDEPFDPWRVYTAEDAFTDTGEPPWVINNLLMEQSATIVSAQPKAMKSLSLLQAAMEAPLTGKVWGHFEARGVKRTLFIETEDPLHLVKARIRGLYKGLGVENAEELEGFHYVRVGPFRLVDEANKLFELLDRYGPDFAVISTLQNILGERDWNSQQNMQPIMEAHCCPGKLSRGTCKRLRVSLLRAFRSKNDLLPAVRGNFRGERASDLE